MRQSGIAVPSGDTLRATRWTRPSMLVTVPSCSPHVVTGRNTSARRELSVRNVSTAITNRAPVIAGGGERPVGTVAVRVGAEQHQRADARRRPRPAGCRARRVPARSGTAPHASSNQSRPSSSVTRPGRKPGREPEVERAAHVAAPQRDEEARACRAPASAAIAATVASARLGEVAPPDDHHDVAVAVRQGRGRGGDVAASRPSRRRARAASSATTAPCSPGVYRMLAAAYGVRPVAVGAMLDQRHAELDRGAPGAQVEDRQLLLGVDAEHDDAAGPVEVGDRRVRQAERDVGGQAVAQLRVDVVGAQHALGEAGPHVGVLVRAAGAAEHADLRRHRRPRAPRGARRPRRSSASGHEHSTSSPPRRIIGCVTRDVVVHRLRSRTDPCRRASPG